MIYPLLNNKTKLFYRKFQKEHNFLTVFFLFLFVKYDVEMKHHIISECRVEYRYRLLTRWIIRIFLTFIMLPISLVLTFRGSIKSWYHSVIGIGNWNYLKSYKLSVAENKLLIRD